MYLVLYYDYIPEILEKRDPYREAHLQHARAHLEKGLLQQAGAFNPPEQGMYIFKTDDETLVEEYARQDPYVINDLVSKWFIKKWNVVVG